MLCISVLDISIFILHFHVVPLLSEWLIIRSFFRIRCQTSLPLPTSFILSLRRYARSCDLHRSHEERAILLGAHQALRDVGLQVRHPDGRHARQRMLRARRGHDPSQRSEQRTRYLRWAHRGRDLELIREPSSVDGSSFRMLILPWKRCYMSSTAADIIFATARASCHCTRGVAEPKAWSVGDFARALLDGEGTQRILECWVVRAGTHVVPAQIGAPRAVRAGVARAGSDRRLCRR